MLSKAPSTGEGATVFPFDIQPGFRRFFTLSKLLFEQQPSWLLHGDSQSPNYRQKSRPLKSPLPG